ncbi:MAG: transcription-repair coupling factor [Clostridia bacterium]|nr:transcription-repair coupling factor [Clostridia bacterium]
MIYKLKSNEINILDKAIKNKEKITVRNLQDAERAFLLSNYDKSILYIASSLVKARIIEKQLSSLGKKVLILSQLLDLISYKANVNEVMETYAYALSQVALNKIDAIIITPELLLQKLPDSSVYMEEIICLEKGNDYNLSSLKSGLLNLGYHRVERVENQSQFSIRGDILDVYPVGYESPFRLEFWGDNIETIKEIDLTSYASKQDVDEIKICPFTFNLGAIDDKKSAFLDNEPNIKEKAFNLIKDNSLIYALPAYKFFNSSFVEWFKNGIVAFEEPKRIYDLANQASLALINDLLRQIEENIFDKVHLSFYYGMKDIVVKDSQTAIAFTNLDVKNPLFFSENVVSFPVINLSNYLSNAELLKSDLTYFKNQNFTVLLSYDKEEQKEILKNILKNNNLPFNENDEIEENKINLTKNNIAYNVGFLNEKFVFIGQDSLFRESKTQSSTIAKSRVFYLPKVGEYVVHQTQGVGKCIDIKKMNLGFCEKDYIVIQYAKGDVLYLPTEHTDEISQYLGAEEEPRLNVLGGEQFKKAKEKAKASLKKMAFDLRELYAKRSALKGFKYSEDNYLIDEFQKARGFELTKDQEDAIADIKKDMESGKVMDRLICGDVGFGKTEVAMFAAFKTILDNKQVAFLAPTTILCHQHFVNVQNRMKDFLVNVGMLSRFNYAKKNKDIINLVASGDINIVCGTHRLLSDDVKFKDLGLLILDEEQRFGVADKEKIKRLKQNVNVLTLSATPIPRTLHMSLIGVRDTSLITTPPKSRLPITSIVCEYSPTILVEACRRELSREGQVLIVYNRVETIYNFANEVRALLPEVEIDVAHGQMDKNTLENVVLKLYAKETQILIATTLIENGIDLPMANTLIVINADTMGLSQLYQLRGRVGRSNRASYAYFTFDKDKIINEVAMKRLDALREFSELGSGFKIAMRDLEIRGAGTLLGAEQHGHIEKIGYDLYCKLLEEAVMELDGKQDRIRRDVKIEIALPAFAPDSYIQSGAERMKLYNDIALITNENQMQDVKKRIRDMYGELPYELEQLIKVGYIKNLAKDCGVKKIALNDFASVIEFYDDFVDIIEKAKTMSLEINSNLKVEIGKANRFTINKALSIKDRQESLIKFLLKLSKVVA